jgi:hypothetical protein
VLAQLPDASAFISPLFGPSRLATSLLYGRSPMLRTRTPDEALAARVLTEFSELPGLRLNLWQTQRLYGVSADEAERTMERLVRAGFLRVTRDGSYGRR